MRPCASWTAKTVVLTLTAGLAATASGLSSVALAASAGSGQAAAQAALPADACSDAGALLGIVGAACQAVTLISPPAAAPAQAGQSGAGTGPAAGSQRNAGSQGAAGSQGSAGSQGAAGGTSQGTAANSGQSGSQSTSQGSAQGSSRGLTATVGQVVERAVAPITAVLGAGGSVPILPANPAPVAAVAGTASSRPAGAAPGADRTPGKTPAHPGDTNVPAATQLAGLGALPGLADLPSAGPASTPAQDGAAGGGIPVPETALSAASSGMSSDSFAALAIGALLAGASALKIAGRRARDRKAGIGVVAQ